MGLLKRRQKSSKDNEWGAGPQPVDPASVDLFEARAVVTGLCQAIGSDAKMREALRPLLDASGMPQADDPLAVIAFADNRDLHTRVWRWLVAVAKRANEGAQNDLAAMAALWALTWQTTVVPGMTGADFISVGFDRPPDSVLSELFEEGALAVSRLPSEFPVAHTSVPETVTAAMMCQAFAIDGSLQRAIDGEKTKRLDTGC
jgi:hypothetical protein